MYCETCGFKLKENDTECIVCMTKVPDNTENEDMIYCPRCGKRTNGKKVYCRVCGEKTITINDGLTEEDKKKKKERAKRVNSGVNLLGGNIAGLVLGAWLIMGISSMITIRKIEKERELTKPESSAKTIGNICLILGCVRIGLVLIWLFSLSFYF